MKSKRSNLPENRLFSLTSKSDNTDNKDVFNKPFKIGNVLSLFDGISCGQLALNRAGIEYENYYASEIEKNSIKVTQHNFPKTIQLGDVTKVLANELPKIDLLIGGSPCTDMSFAGKQRGMTTTCKQEILTLDDYLTFKQEGFEFTGQSYLFWEYVRLLTELKPKYFLLENVVMSKHWESVISGVLGCEPILIDSARVSAQTRKRLYWTNIPQINQPDDKNVRLADVLDDISCGTNSGAIRGRYLNKATIVGRRLDENGVRKDYDKKVPITQCLEVRATNRDKSNCLTTVQKDNVLTSLPIGRHEDVYGRKLPYRYFTAEECERLQTVPTGYTSVVGNSHRVKALGNGWTVDVIAHIFSHMKK